ncbi:uncharacterized protein [Parasteatoda tepidariorum]|uniref:uncharacterized protein isoform X2 n=1 Tax=Parasteatoda tepidariorum TaxID=114398 RepID=UPI0039BD439F
MVDITAKLFWYRTKEWYEIMADKVNDIVYTDETKETVNVINLLLLGWILLGLIVYLLGNFVANYFKKQKNILSSRNSETADDVSKLTEHVPSESEVETEVENNVQELEKLQLKRQIPTCEGDDPEIVEWFNKLFLWIYNQRIVSPILDAWISALNARTRLSSTEHGILVDFNEVIHTSSAPKVTNAFQFQSSKNECPILTCDTEVEDVAFDIIVTQFKEKEKVSQHFTLVVKRLAGKAYIECMPEDVSFAAKYSEVPQVQLSVGFATSGNSAAQMIDSGDIQPLSDLVCEICHEAFASALINFRLACFPDCPRLSPKFYAGDEEITSTQVSDDKQLLVKIIKASNLGGSQGCLKPYCVVEMDEPPQRFETHCVEEKHNPFWDESYTFTVKDISAELLFEIYDKEKPSTENFLGLGIVSIEELLRNPSQRQMIPLQSRPLEDDDVTGTLTAEFLFLNQLTPVSEATHLSQVNARSDQLSETGKSVETNCRVTAGGTVITTTTIKRTNEEIVQSPEATSNLHANSMQSAEHNVTNTPDAKETLFEKKNIAYELNSQVSNGGCKISNGDIFVNNISDENNSEFAVLNKNLTHDNKELVEVAALEEPEIVEFKIETIGDDKISVESKGELHPNGLSPSASPSPHVHEVPVIIPKPPIIIVDNLGETQPQKDELLNGSPNADSLELSALHDNTLSVENNNNDSKETEENGIGFSSELPPISEIIVNNSTPSGGLEIDDGDADLADTALKEIEKLSKPNSTSKSTLIIHSVQRENLLPNVKVAQDKSGEWQEYREPNNHVSDSLEASPASQISKDSRTSYSESVPSSPTPDRTPNGRSRPTEKKSFMGTLRRKLSFHKARSKSVENRSEAPSTYSQASSRSASTDRVRHLSNQKSPFKERLLGSTRSSISEASGVSGLSTRTYINENSTLVIETNENGIIKRYLIPNSLIHRSKWKKKGTKLHIYNDHVFIAKHLPGVTVCQVCQKSLTRRPGKQGYECRGCNLQCHKSCHVKVEEFCSNSSVNSMEVEYVHDPKTASPKSI